MSSFLMLAVAIVYVFTAIDLYINNQLGLSLAFLAYALANVGLYYAGRGI